MPDRLLFVGGTFDPVHHGHLIVARSIAEQLNLPRATLVPAWQAPHKEAHQASPQDRLAMLRLAVEGDPMLEICDLELNRKGPSYTLHTVRELRSMHGAAELIWAIGADMLRDLPKWYKAGELLDEVTMVVAARPPQTDLEPVYSQLERDLGPQRVARLRHNTLATPVIDISSTEIRVRAACGLPLRYLVPPAVERYVLERHLYVGEKPTAAP